MFTLLFRKMLKTRWMVLCLFIGFLMAAGMMSAVPIYMDASLQRMLIKDMEAYQLSTGEFPGVYTVEKSVPAGTSAAEQLSLLHELPETVRKRVNGVKIPVGTFKAAGTDNLQYLAREDGSQTRVRLSSMTDLREHVSIKSGRMYCEGGQADDGTYEVIASELAMKSLGTFLDKDYTVHSFDTGKEQIRVRIVGIYEQASDNDTYWSETIDSYLNTVFLDEGCFERLIGRSAQLTSVSVRCAFSYQSMDMNDLPTVTTALSDDFIFYKENGCDFRMGIYNILLGYADEAKKLTGILWTLQIPTMVMLAFYLFMVSRLNVEQEKNEIAVFKSRGASSRQIFFLYAAECGILGLATLITAPLIGLLLCRFLGVSNGFLEFVNRTGIAAKITGTAVIYALIAVVVFLLTTLIPIIPASKLSIVEYKQSQSRVVKVQLWEKCCVDILLIAAGLGFYMIYTANEKTSAQSSGTIDPMFFIFASCLVMGLGLFFIRVYPYFLRAVYNIFKPLWTPAQYMAITSVSRAQGGRVRFLMLFLIVTFSLGIFSANTARTINDQKEDRIYYSVGADVRLKEYWTENSSDDGRTHGYTESDFSRFEQLSGVKTATRVLVNDTAKVSSGKTTESGVTLMAIEPYKFSQTAWFRGDLAPVHWWNYCSALQKYPSGVIISRALANKLDLKAGDYISAKWSGNDSIEAAIVAVVDYWPGINPNESGKAQQKKRAAADDDDGEGEPSYAVKCFAVMNYNHVYELTDLEPYEVWLRLEDGASSEALYADIRAHKMPLEFISDAGQLLISEKNHPQLQGMNGALTMGFVMIMIMTLIGFLIYWILSIKSRTLQFGILRAMGVTFREIIAMIGYEQLLVSGVSAAMAFIIGGVASDLFVPLFRSMYSLAEQVPPFRVAAAQSDYIKIYVIIAVMLCGGFIILGRLIGKININKALKLGED